MVKIDSGLQMFGYALLLLANWSSLSTTQTALQLLAITAYVCSLCAALTRESHPEASKLFSSAKVGVWAVFYGIAFTTPSTLPWYSSMAFLALLAPTGAEVSSALFLAYYVFSAAASLETYDAVQGIARVALAVVAARGVLASAHASDLASAHASAYASAHASAHASDLTS